MSAGRSYSTFRGATGDSAGKEIHLPGKPDSALIVRTVQWVGRCNPEWVAFEQVPAVLPVWQAACLGLAELGYSSWAGVLNAADFGVPQTRRRAFLMASRVSEVQPPEPTHSVGSFSLLSRLGARHGSHWGTFERFRRSFRSSCVTFTLSSPSTPPSTDSTRIR